MLDVADAMRAGSTKACDIFRVAARSLERAGYSRYIPDFVPELLGHSIGVEVHEAPWLTPVYDDILRIDMVFAIEPSILLPGRHYLRMEDMVRIGPRRTEFLTKFSRELFVIN